MLTIKTVDFSNNRWQKYLLLGIIWALLLAAAIFLRSILLPFLLSVLFAYVLEPVMRSLERVRIFNRKISRTASICIIYFVVTAFTVAFFFFFAPQIYHELTKLAKDATALINTIDEATIAEMGLRLELFFRDYEIPIEIVPPPNFSEMWPKTSGHHHIVSIDLNTVSQNIINNIINYTKSETKNIIISAQVFFSKFFSSIFMALLIFMITAFILVDKARIKSYLFKLVPPKQQPQFNNFLSQIDQGLSGVVRGQLIICLINAILTLLGLLLLGVNFAFILATLAGIFSLVPIFGSIISTIPIVLVALTSSPLTAFLALLWIVFIHGLEANLLNPKIMGDSAKIHPILIILALLAGKHYYGIIGALLAVPIMSIFTTIFVALLNRLKMVDE